MKQKLFAAAPLILPLLGIASVHIVGFGNYSDYRLIELFDFATVASITYVFTLHLLLAALWARVLFLFLSGTLLLIVAFAFGPLERARYRLRVLVVLVRRKTWFEAVVVAVLGLGFFSLSYLQLHLFSLTTVLVVSTLGLGVYHVGRLNLVLASEFIRGQRPKRLKPTQMFKSETSEQAERRERHNRCIVDQLIREPKQIILLTYLVLALLSFSFGSMREGALRSDDNSWSFSDYRRMLPVSGGSIAWDAQSDTYVLVRNGEVEWRLAPVEVSK